MAVTWVAGTVFDDEDAATSISSAAPTGLADDDRLFAAVFARSTITPPSGWTLVEASGAFSDVNFTQYLSVYEKNTVTTADSGASFTWSQSATDRIGVVYAAVRDVDTIAETDSSAGTGTDFAYTGPALTATTDGEMVLSFVSLVYGDIEEAQAPSPPSGMTLTSGTGAFSYRIGAAYKSVNSGQSGGGAWDLHPTWTDPYTLSPFDNPAGAVTIRMTSAADPTLAYLSAPDPLTAAGDPQIVGEMPPLALLADSGPLGEPSVQAWMDFTGAVDTTAPVRYVVDLHTPSGDVRAPISSWQATQQTDQANYLQCVIPACDPYVDAIADATAFTVSRRGKLVDGSDVEYVMATSAVTEATFNRSPARNTCTLSGYSDAFTADDNPPSLFDRELTDVRLITTSGSGTRVRCAIDWLLRPAQRAIVGADSFVVSYINWYANVDDEFMDVGSRTDAGA